jgi:uncharacterized protein
MRESRYNIWARHGGHDYVYNGISGMLLRVPTESIGAVRDFIAGDDNALVSPEVMRNLVLGRMVINDDTDEIAMLERRYRSSQRDDTRLGLTIVTSLGCNFDCPYCFEAKHPSLMEPAIQEMLLDLLREQAHRLTHLRVTWFGGEPLVGKKALFAMSDAFIALCDESNVSYSADITTNGYLLTSAVARSLVARRVESAQVTLDGPPEVHDRMRPLVSGRPTFWKIVRNLVAVADIIPLSIRVNVDATNADRYEELLQILCNQGLAGKVFVYPAHIVLPEGSGAPSATYRAPCLNFPEFADLEHAFIQRAAELGFSGASLPGPTGAPCTAVRANDLVVGSRGELYKCWDTVGDHREVIGHLRNWRDPNDRILKWLHYDPFTNDECRACPALPVCMGGCTFHAMDEKLYDSRCSTFRFTHSQQVQTFVEQADAAHTDGLIRAAHYKIATDTR